MNGKERDILTRLDTKVFDIKETLNELKTDNKESHDKIFNELGSMSTRVTKIESCTVNNKKDIKEHKDGHWKFASLLLGGGGIFGVIVTILSAII